MNGYDPRQPPYPHYPPPPPSGPVLGPNGQIQVGGIVIQNNMGQPQAPAYSGQPGQQGPMGGEQGLVRSSSSDAAEFLARSPSNRLAAAMLGTVVFGTISLLASLGVLAPGLLLFTTLPTVTFAVVAGFLAWSGRKGGATALAAAAELEAKVVQLAAKHGGTLTVLDVVAGLQVSSDLADAALQRLVKAGHITPDVDMQTGALTYTFPLSAIAERSQQRLGPGS